MAASAKVFDDPQYSRVESGDDTYDSPSPFLDRVPQRPVDAGQQQQTVEESGDYSTVDDFLDDEENEHHDDYSDGEGSFSDSEVGEEEEQGEGGEARPRKNRFSRVRQSWSENMERSNRIYVRGDIIPLQPMLSFKSRARARSREELEQDGIYQGLRITNEQRQQIGIMPESIYMTVALEKSREVLDNMSMEIGQQPPSRPVSGSSQRRSSVSPSYRGLILYPPPLPPLSQGAPTTQVTVQLRQSLVPRKCHAIMENILKSEAAFLTSLKVAEQVYMRPMLEMSSPPIDKDQVRTLFGPIVDLMGHHELFYTALTERTMNWSPKQRVGNVFMTFYRREVIAHYVAYVNNFTEAMATLQRNIKKKQKFVSFLEQKYRESKTSLSLQGLLLKPVQRFPQYILFLQDLIKYTPPHHPDRVTLQLALARCETIAEHLNEAKRTKEQQTIVTHLSSRVTHLPFKLSDSPNRCLLLQEQVTRLILSPQGSDNLVQHKRSLLLFNNMVMCAALNKKTNGESSRDVGVLEDAHYKCKWQSPLDRLTVMEPDYSNDIWDHLVAQGDTEEATAYQELKSEYTKYTQDFLTMGKIASLVSALKDSYPGLKLSTVQSLLRVLQRKLARTREELKRHQPGRLDIQIPSRDEGHLVHHTYVFESEKAKHIFMNNLRYATLKLKEENKKAWVCAESAEDDDVIIDSVGHLPLFVEHYQLTNTSQCLTTECATKTHSNQVWFASCSSNTAEVAIIQSLTPKPMLLKSFTVDSTRILAMCYVPRDSSSHQVSPLQSSMSSAFIGAPSLSPNSETIWMGSQTGKLMIHPTSNEMAHKVIEVINFAGAITCIEYYKNQVFIAVDENIYIYKRPKESVWDLDNPVVFRVHDGEDPITCMCQVQQKLWMGAGNQCYIFNMASSRREGNFQVSQKAGAVVRGMASSGSGVWVSLRRSPTVQLFHTVTKTLLQEIDIEKAFRNIAARHNLGSKLHGVTNLHITSLLLCKGYLWLGTSTGAIMVYRTPYLKTVPITTGKPYMALHGHTNGVRVLISTQTAGTLSSSRFDQFVSEEQERFQEEWEPVEEEGELQSPMYGGNEVFPGGENGTLPSEEAGDSSTFPPLPPPNFNDLSPSGTLKLPTTEPDGGDAGGEQGTSGGEQGTSDTLKAQQDANSHTGNTEALTEAPSTTETQGAADSSESQGKSDGPAMPVRRKSSNKKKLEEGRNPALETEDTGTFRRRNTLEAAARAGSWPSPVDKERESQTTPSPQPILEVTPPPLYDEVTPDEDDSPSQDRKRSPSPYEDPSTLHLTGPIHLGPVPDFFRTLDQSVAPAFSSGSTEGAIYVLTGGRGFVYPGRRKSIITPGDSDESCIIAYELKH